MLLLYQLFYNDDNNTVNDSDYVPKSKRFPLWKWTNPMTTWLKRKVCIIENNIMAWNTLRTQRQKLNRAINNARNMKIPKRNYRMAAMLCFAAVAMQANGSNTQERRAIFDTDSEPIGVDNCCTGCISHRMEDFVGPLLDSKRSIKGFGGSKTSNVNE